MDLPENLYLEMFKRIPVLSVDAVIIQNQQILFAKRNIEPYKDYWCLPGGRMDIGETCENAVVREAREETGLICTVEKLLGVYSGPGRDPRGHTVSIGYLLKPVGGKLTGNFESSELKFFPLPEIPKDLGFDHQSIVKDALSFLNT